MRTKTLITLFSAAFLGFLSGAVISQAQGYNFGTGIPTHFGTGINTTFGAGTSTNADSGHSYGQNIIGVPVPAGQNNTSQNPTTSVAPTSNTQHPQPHPTPPPPPPRNHYYFIPWGWGSSYAYPEAKSAEEAKETSTSSDKTGSNSVESTSSDLFKINVDLAQFKNNADNVKMSVNNHTIRVYGGSYSQTFKTEKKIVKNGIRKEVSGNTLIIYVPLKD